MDTLPFLVRVLGPPILVFASAATVAGIVWVVGQFFPEWYRRD